MRRKFKENKIEQKKGTGEGWNRDVLSHSVSVQIQHKNNESNNKHIFSQ